MNFPRILIPSASLGMLVALWASTAACSVPTVEECLEGSDFIANAARARDAGMEREAFVGRLEADLATIRAFPPALRWFAHDGTDEAFLRTATLAVFDEPVTPESHRVLFLRACFERLGD